MAALQSTENALNAPAALCTLITGIGAPEVRLRLRAEIRRRIKRIDFDFEYLKEGVYINIEFSNGVHRDIFMTKKHTSN